MSAVLQSNQEDPRVLPFAPPSRQTFELQLKQLTSVEHKVISELHLLSEEDVRHTRKKAKHVGSTGWRIECACDYELWKRADRLKGGRGRVAKDEGVAAALAKQAHIVGVTPNTIFNNAKIYELIKDVQETHIINNDSLARLDEKGFFIAALSATDQVGAVKRFVEKKIKDPKFRVSQAFRLLEETGSTKKLARLKVTSAVRTASSETLFIYLKELKGVLSRCPNQDIFDRMLCDCYNDVKNQIEEMYDEDAASALTKAWSSECNSEEELATATGLPLEDVSRIMKKLSALSAEKGFIKVRGPGSQRWHKVGEPLPAELRQRRA